MLLPPQEVDEGYQPAQQKAGDDQGPDDDDGDHRRNLYIANSHAREALARSKGGAS
jgi:hypothetical protein